MATEQTSTVTTTDGGIMTDDVGAITGEVDITTVAHRSHKVEVKVMYTGADESYVVTGSPVVVAEGDAHMKVVTALTTPGPVVDGNESAVLLPAEL